MTTSTEFEPGSDEPRVKSSRPRKAKASTIPKGKRSLNLSIPIEDHRRISLHALMMGMTISDLVCKLGREHLRDYHITRTGSREPVQDQ